LRRGNLNHGGNPLAFAAHLSATRALGQGGLRAGLTFPNLTPHFGEEAMAGVLA
jgi:hypothetical protein